MAMGKQESHVRDELLAASDEVIDDAVAHADTAALRGLLYQVEPTDAATFGAVCAILLLIALSASALPAWRAGRMSPLLALKSE